MVAVKEVHKTWEMRTKERQQRASLNKIRTELKTADAEEKEVQLLLCSLPKLCTRKREDGPNKEKNNELKTRRNHRVYSWYASLLSI